MTINKVLIFSLLSFGIFSNLFSQDNWNLLNPKPSANAGWGIHFVSDETGYIITGRELLETSDAGSTWHKKQDILSANDMDFKGSLGFIAGNSGYLLRSNDYGSSWQEVDAGTNAPLNTVNIIDQDTIIISGSNSLLKSFDGGNSWAESSIPGVSVKKTFFITGQVGHAACAGGTILKTIDGGNSWYITESVSITPSDFFEIYFVNEHTGFASREHDYIFKTTNSGESWVEIKSGPAATYAFYFLDENTGYICGADGLLFKTIDGGNNWNWVGFQNGLFYYTDMYGLFFLTADIGFATGARGRIIKTVDGGATWTEYAPTYNDIIQLSFPTENIGYAQVDERFYKTTDAGLNWVFVGSPDFNGYGFPNGFDFVDESTGYAISGGTLTPSGQIFKTSDGGVTWTELNNVSQFFQSGYNALEFVNEDVGYISKYGNGNEERSVYKTENGGVTWVEVLHSNSFEQIQFMDLQTGYARNNTFSGKIYKTIDGGQNWSVVFDIDEDIRAFHFVNNNTGYLVGDQSLLYKTIDGGASWQVLAAPYGYYVAVQFYSENIGYIADDYGKVYKTTNGGITWQLSIESYQIKDITISGGDVYLGCTYGKILKNSLAPVSVNNVHSDNSGYLVFPNPATRRLHVTAPDGKKIVSIKVINISGREVLQLDNPEPVDKLELNVSGLTRGIYFLEISARDSIRMEKIVLQ